MLYSVQDILTLCPSGTRLMGLDVGSKTIGIAISDTNWQIASPLKVLQRTKQTLDIMAVLKIAQEYAMTGIVVGLPVNMNGTYGPQAEKMTAFAEDLSSQTDLIVTLWDERLSTTAVNRTLLDADMSRKRRGEVVDKLAATFILQGALDRLRIIKRESTET